MSQKIENQLNLALDATETEREDSLNLGVGFQSEERTWEVIVKYSGSLQRVRELGIQVVELLGGYAIMVVPEDLLDSLADIPQIEYIEKPKHLYFLDEEGRRASCINEVQRPPLELYGNGVLIGVIDSGIDYANPVFRNENGETRIRALWDQTISGIPPRGYDRGTEYSKEQINEALQAETLQERYRLVPSRDASGHGTAVAGIAAGYTQGEESYRGVALESELIVVKMGNAQAGGFPRTTELMLGLDYVVRKAMEEQMPVAVNLSFGNTYGAHDGSSLLERYIDQLSFMWKSVICIGSGNEGNTAGHVYGRVMEDADTIVELAIQENEPTVNVQIWKAYQDVMEISLISPSGVRVGPISETLGTQRFQVDRTEILLYYGTPSPFSIDQEIYLDLLPTESYIASGIWRIVLTPKSIVTGEFAMWLPSEAALNVGTEFLQPSQVGTITIPATAQRPIAVGAYDARTGQYADFSGRGRFGGGIRIKPDLAAPGVEILAPLVNGGYGRFRGTSFATPFVTGSAALLMEWGIVQNHDPYLYGEKVKAYLQRGARPLPGLDTYPNQEVGWGALCLRDSFPE